MLWNKEIKVRVPPISNQKTMLFYLCSLTAERRTNDGIFQNRNCQWHLILNATCTGKFLSIQKAKLTRKYEMHSDNDDVVNTMESKVVGLVSTYSWSSITERCDLSVKCLRGWIQEDIRLIGLCCFSRHLPLILIDRSFKVGH